MANNDALLQNSDDDNNEENQDFENEYENEEENDDDALSDADLLEIILTASTEDEKSLDLCYRGIYQLPSEIEMLTELEELFLDGNYLTRLPPEIWNLKKLQRLSLSDNKISVLDSEIENLVNLQELSISNNRLTYLPLEIGNLTNLIYLNVGNTLGNQLSFFDLMGEDNPYKNRFDTIPSEIGNLVNLKYLLAENTNLTEIPSEIIRLINLEQLSLQNNPLSIPVEILSKEYAPQAILFHYFIQLTKKPKHLNESKLLVVGQGSVGKTSLVQQILSKKFVENQLKTDGISIDRWEVNNQSQISLQQPKIQLNIWDFGGQEIMHATHQFFLTKRSLYLLVLDSRLTQEENRIEYWLKIIQSFGGESPVLIVGNKIDQHPLDIDHTGLQKKYPNIVGIVETSAATGAGIEELKVAITEQVNNLPHVRDLLPETWFNVKKQLEEQREKTNFINHDDYVKLCAENEVSDETSQHTLIGFLHDLGVVLHFQDDPRLEALGILNPQWVTNGVYKILNSHTLFQNKGVLTVSLLDEILDLPEYPRGKRLFIVDMMKKFELCYDIEPDKTFLVPDLLPKDETALNFQGIQVFEYVYPVLPSSIMTRFIVRMNQHIDDGFVWRTGVILKIGENTALVKADIEDRTVRIAMAGREETRRDALAAIRYQLDEIHASIKGLNPEKRVPIPDAPNAEPLDYDYLLQLERDGELENLPVKDGNRLVKVNVRKLLSGVVSEAERKGVAGNTTTIYINGDMKGSLIAGDENQVRYRNEENTGLNP